ncbi:hypothetical protein AN963_28135 [Brevibacillus choshinensis]|uniref:Glycerophosphoryl diester phosphodiesterase membrane domain-containing protein n=1 Tax=Brevibacillus choshinensis TaxID=54911 RepID=A0ABR5N3U5_BRECH|nr:hypothetical protein [Brevibacillus choshinensis]KQL45165.1 hypothetical protein AN963_28135 [Brevibacillus choshinensis]
MNPLKESFHFYTRHIESLLLLSAVIVLPFMIVHNMTINYVSFLAAITGAKVVSSFFNLFLLLLFFMVVQVPFAQYVITDLEGEERPLRQAFRAFAEQGISVFLFGVVYVLAVSIGMVLFVVPGLLLLILFFLTPYVAVVKGKTPWQCLRSAFELGKRHFVPIVGLLILTSVIEWGISMIGLLSVTSITTSFGAVFFTQLLLYVMLCPFISVLFTLYTRKWSTEQVRKQEELAWEG